MIALFPPGRPMTKILIVEDEPFVAEAMAMILKDAGYEIAGIATDETSAVRSAAAIRPDLALIEIKLARNSDGVETARRLQSGGPMAVVFVSANLDQGTRRRASDLHLARYLAKPYSPAALLQTVAASLRWEDACDDRDHLLGRNGFGQIGDRPE